MPADHHGGIERYYLLLGQALGDVRLTRREATWLAATEFQHQVDETMSGDPFVAEHENPALQG